MRVVQNEILDIEEFAENPHTNRRVEKMRRRHLDYAASARRAARVDKRLLSSIRCQAGKAPDFFAVQVAI